MKKKIYHKIANAYDAFWFIHDHPKFQRMIRVEITPKEADEQEKQGFLVSRDRSGTCYRYHRHLVVPALDENLSIFYTKTDGKRVNNDPKKNTKVECWLEFGPVEYGYMAGDINADWDVETHEQNFHDWKLDCGGSTFDEALIKLARNIRRIRGDYAPRTRADKCGPKPCADCVENGVTMKKLGLEPKSQAETLKGLDEVEAYLKDDRPTCPSCGEKINDEMGHMCP
jgi:hypothetical protein